MDKILLILIIIFLLFSNHKSLVGSGVSEILLKILFLYVFIFGALEYVGLPEFIRKFLIDILVGLLLFLQTKRRKFEFPGFNWFLVLSGLLIVSAILSSSSPYQTFTYYRTFLYPYVVFLVVYNLKMPEKKWLSFNKLIFTIFILQIAASVLKLIFIGVNEKVLIGTVSISGGTFSTMLPLAAISFIFAFFLFYKQDLRYILLIMGFLFMAYMGAKRGIWIYTPAILLLSIYFYVRLTVSFSKKIMRLSIFVLFFSVATIIFGSKYSATLNPDKRVGGRLDLEYFQEYTLDYTFSTSEDEQITHGRGANFLSVSEKLFNNPSLNSIFGYGPESAKGVATYGEGIWKTLGVNGPITGLTYHLVQLGLIFCFFLIFLAFKISALFFKVARSETDGYWKSFCFGSFMMVIVFLVDLVTYSSAFIATIFPLSFSLAYASAVVLKRKSYQEQIIISNADRLTIGHNCYPVI